ncbi:MAG: hypothetical protein LWY06_19195 [Firmicutes bacterium]|nr:hypothetical protein [Bacillota bacterium]
MKKIGVFSASEEFSHAVIHKINGFNHSDIKAEFALAGETRLFEPSHYKVIIDRLSYYVDYFKVYFKNAAMSGSSVINNPFKTCNSDRFYNYSIAKKMGALIPRTVCLPSKEQHPACSNDDLLNLKYPLDWEEIADFVGFPAILKSYDGYGYRDVYNVHNVEELLQAYNGSGRQVMILQEFIKYDLFVKAFVVGKKDILVVKYDPASRGYLDDSPEDKSLPGRNMIDGAVDLAKELDLDFYAMELAIKGDAAYAVNFINPVPNCRPETVSQKNFDWLVDKFAALAIEHARNNKTTTCG